MRALYFGTYDRTYPRNAQVISCLRGAGIEVIENHREVWRRHNWSLGARQLMRLLNAELRLSASRRDHDADVVIVGYPGQFDLPAARLVARGRPIVFNPLVSLHDTLVTDRARFGAGGAAARILRAIDASAFRHVALVVADTRSHAAFFEETFGVEPERLGVALVGAEDRLFHPAPAPESGFCALFVGKLVPLQGIETILEAARLAPEIPFRIIGEGQLSAAVEARPANVEYLPWVEYEALPGEYQRAGCALGIFGVGPKAARVIPNKVFQALACAAPLVTAATPAARELLRDGHDAVLVPPGDAPALAAAVRALSQDPSRAATIAAEGRQTYVRQASEPALGQVWRALLERAVGAH